MQHEQQEVVGNQITGKKSLIGKGFFGIERSVI